MKTKKLIITLAAIMLVSFCITPAANAAVVVGGTVLAISAAVFAIGILMDKVADKANADQQKAENAINNPATARMDTPKVVPQGVE